MTSMKFFGGWTEITHFKVLLVLAIFAALLLGGCATTQEHTLQEVSAYGELCATRGQVATINPDNSLSCVDAPSTPPAVDVHYDTFVIPNDLKQIYNLTGCRRWEVDHCGWNMSRQDIPDFECWKCLNIHNIFATPPASHTILTSCNITCPAKSTCTIAENILCQPPSENATALECASPYYWHGEYCLKNETRYIDAECPLPTEENSPVHCNILCRYDGSGCRYVEKVQSPRLVSPDLCPLRGTKLECGDKIYNATNQAFFLDDVRDCLERNLTTEIYDSDNISVRGCGGTGDVWKRVECGDAICYECVEVDANAN